MKPGKIISVSLLIITAGLAGAGVSYYLTELNEPEAVYTATDNPKLQEIRQDLKTLKKELRDAGNYACCIKGDCNWCALHMGHCPCEDLVQKKGEEKSCPECAAAWNRKQGKVPGVDPDAIKVTTFGIYGEEEGHHAGGEHTHQADSNVRRDRDDANRPPAHDEEHEHTESEKEIIDDAAGS